MCERENKREKKKSKNNNKYKLFCTITEGVFVYGCIVQITDVWLSDKLKMSEWVTEWLMYNQYVQTICALFEY